MRHLYLLFPLMDLKALLDQKQSELTFVTQEPDGPLMIHLAVREHHRSNTKGQALGRPPRKA